MISLKPRYVSGKRVFLNVSLESVRQAMKKEKYPELQELWDRFNDMEAEICRKKVELEPFDFSDWQYEDDPGVYNFIGCLSQISGRAPKPDEYTRRKLAVVRVYEHPEEGRRYRLFCSRPIEGARDTRQQLIFGLRKFKSGPVMGLLRAYFTCDRCHGTGIPKWDAQPGEKCDCPGARGLHKFEMKGNIPIPLGKRIDELLFGRDTFEAVDW